MTRTIVIDTSVLSQFFRKTGPSEKLQAWLQEALSDRLLISAITRYEMMSGLAALPSKSILDDFHAFIVDGGIGIVPVSTEVADCAGLKRAELKRVGRTIEMGDLLIGATAVANTEESVWIATANERHFDCWGLELLNPV